MTPILILGVTIIVKATLIALGALAADVALRCNRTTSRTFLFLPAVLILLPAAPAVVPTWISPSIQVSHAVLSAPVVSVAPELSWSVVGLGIWLLGTAYRLGRLLFSWRAGRLVARAAQSDADVRLKDIVARAANAVTIVGRLPLVLHSSAVQSPAMIGYKEPVILLPLEARSWPSEELFGVICHELSHIKKGDWLCFILEEIAAALYWPAPFVRSMWRRTALRRELAADRAALAAGVPPSSYAARLIAVARACTREQVVAGLAFGSRDRNDLTIRVKSLFTENHHSSARSPLPGLIAIAMIALAAAQPVECVSSRATSTITQACP
jgi:beta-lactamase regulating signal transducer with metallopeptidase domain